MLTPTLLIGLIIAVTIVAAYVKYRDTFHPALLLGPMLAFHYCYTPLMLIATNGFEEFLPDPLVTRAQWIHLSGVLAMCLGLLAGSVRSTPIPGPPKEITELFDRRTLLRGCVFLGLAGIASFVAGIVNVGGFAEAYGSSYGGGWIESGYLRELVLLCLPCLIVFIFCHQRRPFTLSTALIGLAMASPFLIHGMLGARRGPTFMAFAGIAIALYMARGKRPRLATLTVGGALVGVLMLFLVSNRKSLYWGSEMKLDADPAELLRLGSGNDFIYGAGLIIVTDELDEFSWGTTYLTTLFIRPIPKSVWPDKYEDTARFFGTSPLTENLGVDKQSFKAVLGWIAPIGAAPGIVGDIWREFSWGMLIPLFAIGWFFGYAWRKTVDGVGAWPAIYCFLASISVYMVMQTLEALLYRFLFGVVPTLWIFHQARKAMATSELLPQARLLPTAETALELRVPR